jgi:hypothetical protein
MARGGARKGAGRKEVLDPKKPVSITLTDLEKSALDEIAKRNNTTRSAAVALMIHRAYMELVS